MTPLDLPDDLPNTYYRLSGDEIDPNDCLTDDFDLAGWYMGAGAADRIDMLRLDAAGQRYETVMQADRA